MEKVSLFLSLAHMCNRCVSLPPPVGEGEEVHATGGQPEAARGGERLHVQQAHLRPLQHRTEVILYICTRQTTHMQQIHIIDHIMQS